MKTASAIIWLALVSPSLAGACGDTVRLTTGETFCADSANVKRHPACKTDPVLCPGAILDPCLPPADPNSAACAVAKAVAADHAAILAQCYSPAGRRTDADAVSKCSQIWR